MFQYNGHPVDATKNDQAKAPSFLVRVKGFLWHGFECLKAHVSAGVCGTKNLLRFVITKLVTLSSYFHLKLAISGDAIYDRPATFGRIDNGPKPVEQYAPPPPPPLAGPAKGPPPQSYGGNAPPPEESKNKYWVMKWHGSCGESINKLWENCTKLKSSIYMWIWFLGFGNVCSRISISFRLFYFGEN